MTPAVGSDGSEIAKARNLICVGQRMYYSYKHLLIAEELVVAAERRVLRQKELIAREISIPESPRVAIELIDVLEAMLEQHKKHRDLIAANLHPDRRG